MAFSLGNLGYLNKPKLVLITEGSLFWKGWQYKKQVEKEPKLLGVPKNAIIFKKIDDSSIKSIKGAIGLLAK